MINLRCQVSVDFIVLLHTNSLMRFVANLCFHCGTLWQKLIKILHQIKLLKNNPLVIIHDFYNNVFCTDEYTLKNNFTLHFRPGKLLYYLIINDKPNINSNMLPRSTNHTAVCF